MARQQVVSYSVICDVCGDGIPEVDIDGASQKVSWEGAEYVVDLCVSDRSALADALSQLKVFVEAGHEQGATGRRRKAGRSSPKAMAAVVRRGSGRQSRSGRSDIAVIRAWALENGHSVGDRGRIPADVVAAYDEAQSGAAVAESPASTPRRRRPRKDVAAAV